jgi:hypothetical protein
VDEMLRIRPGNETNTVDYQQLIKMLKSDDEQLLNDNK